MSHEMTIGDHIFKEELLMNIGDKLSSIVVNLWWEDDIQNITPLANIRDCVVYMFDGKLSIHTPIRYKGRDVDVVLHCTRIVEKTKDCGNVINLGEQVVYKDWYVDKCTVIHSGIHLEVFYQLQFKLNNIC